jgi:hypothetical protein
MSLVYRGADSLWLKKKTHCRIDIDFLPLIQILSEYSIHTCNNLPWRGREGVMERRRE